MSGLRQSLRRAYATAVLAYAGGGFQRGSNVARSFQSQCKLYTSPMTLKQPFNKPKTRPRDGRGPWANTTTGRVPWVYGPRRSFPQIGRMQNLWPQVLLGIHPGTMIGT